MIVQVQDILKDALGLIGVTEADETPSSFDMSLALRTANIMIDRWSSQRLMLRSTTPIVFTVNANVATYTIGIATPPCDIAVVKPINFVSCFLRDSSNTDTNLDIFTKQQYDALNDKDIANGQPELMMYDPGASQQTYQTGEISFYPIPEQTYTAYAEADCYLTEFVNLTDNITFEPAYYEALIYNLGVRLWRRYHTEKPLPQDIAVLASEAKHSIETMNAVQYTSAMEFPGKSSGYNVYTDGY